MINYDSLVCLNARREGISTMELLEAIDKLGSRFVVIEGDPQRANEVAAQRPGVQVIYRDYFPYGPRGDDRLYLEATPEQFVQHMQGLGLLPGIWWYCVNEPDTDLPGLVQWLLRAMALAGALGRVLVLGNFSVGVPEPEDWRGVLLPLLEALGRSEHVLGIHEYIGGRYEWSVPHYVGRYREVLQLAAEKALGRIRLLVTEFGFDLMGSWQLLGIGAAGLAEGLRRALQQFYAVDGIGVCLFSFGNWSRGKPDDENYTGDFDVRPALSALAAISGQFRIAGGVGDGVGNGEDGMDTVVWIPGIARPYGDYYVNLRAEAMAEAADLGDLYAGDQVEFFPVRGDWWRVRKVVDGATIEGWAHVGYVEIIPDLTRWNEGAGDDGEGDGEPDDQVNSQARIAELEQALVEEKAARQYAEAYVEQMTPYRDCLLRIESEVIDTLYGLAGKVESSS